ncbi:unnamed protein product [Urochloa humidicola]
MGRKKKRLGRLPVDRLPYFMRMPSPGPSRRKTRDRSMQKPKGSPLGVQHVQPKVRAPDVQPKGPTPGHDSTANWATPSTGKRTVFED